MLVFMRPVVGKVGVDLPAASCYNICKEFYFIKFCGCRRPVLRTVAVLTASQKCPCKQAFLHRGILRRRENVRGANSGGWSHASGVGRASCVMAAAAKIFYQASAAVGTAKQNPRKKNTAGIKEKRTRRRKENGHCDYNRRLVRHRAGICAFHRPCRRSGRVSVDSAEPGEAGSPAG